MKDFKKTFNLAGSYFEDFLKHFNKLERIAKKLNVTPPTYKVEKTYEQEVLNSLNKDNLFHWFYEGGGQYITVKTITVEGEAPTLSGWTFLGVVEPGTPEANMLKEAPGKKIPVKYRTGDLYCDHCKTYRKRNSTVIAERENETVQIGTTCLKDYFGYHVNPEEMLTFLDSMTHNRFFSREYHEVVITGGGPDDEDGPCEWQGGGGYSAYSVAKVLEYTAKWVACRGFLSSSRVYNNPELGQPTAHLIRAIFTKAGQGVTQEERAEMEEILKESPVANVAEMTAWILENDPGESNYLHNLKTIVQSGQCTWKDFGLLCSLPSTYNRAMGKLKAAQKKKDGPVSEWVGAIKKRAEYTVTVEKLVPCYSEWGESALHIMTVDGANKMLWFASESAQWLEEGKTYKVKATVKAHEEKDFNGVTEKQTKVNRVAILEEIENAA